jgi:hypothetical protein
MQLLPEASDKLGTSIGNNGLQHTMQTQDMRNIQLSVIFSPVEGVHWNEMSRLGKSVDNYPNGVKFVAGERQTHNKIQIDVFPFAGRNTQRLQQSRKPHMISEQSHVSYGSTRIVSSNHDTSLCCPGGWNIWKCELYQISSCATHGSLEPPNDP